tara:strand:+ start:10095 stop:10439 length:345 start_codon:yes stop_codon:yes gene_type:complete
METNKINYSDFEKVDIRLGTIIKAEENNQLKKPSILLEIDFGEDIGIKKSSAQIQKNYISKELINKQIIAVVNFKPKQIGKTISEVLVLGLPDNNYEPILLFPNIKLQNGIKLY